jgi:hypothetical protein
MNDKAADGKAWMLWKQLRIQIQRPWAVFIVLLVVGIGAYGLQLAHLGFYWDDWPWVWFSHIMGPKGMLKIDVEHRPLSGVVLYVGSLFSGENPLRWQLYNLSFRVGGVLALYWALAQVWPHKRRSNVWATLLFLAYPGFSQQFVAINTSRHLFPLVPFFISLGLTARALRTPERYWRNTIAAMALSLVSMFTTEYYYGLELSRLVLIWLLVRRVKLFFRIGISSC